MRHQKLSKNKNARCLQQRFAIASTNRESAIARSSIHPIEELQSAIGNRAVNRLLANQPKLPAQPMFRGLSHELRSPTPIQTKLAIASSSSSGSLSSVVQRTQQDQNSMNEDETQQLESGIGTRLREGILAGKQTPWEPKFKGISVQIGSDSEQLSEPIQEKEKSNIGVSEVQPENKTGLPDRLKAGIENMSGIAMDNVRVHYNSSKPVELQALAYTQGTDIYVAPGQEQHLPHEAWHVVQQKQGRVKPTGQDREVAINDDTTLEHEADVMGKRVNSFEDRNLLGKTVGDSGMMGNDLSSTSFPIVLQRVKTSFTNDLRNANPAYLRELSTIDNPGLWDYTNQGTFAVSHKGRKYALGVDDAEYSDSILARTTRTKWGWGRYHFRQEIDVKDDQLKDDLHGKDCSNAAEYLMHYEQGIDLTDSSITPKSQEETTTHTNADYDFTTQRPNVLPAQVPANVKDANARAEIGEAYCIVSQPGAQGVYNFHYGCVAAKKGDEALTVEGFATSSATVPDWSFNVYDSITTFHHHWKVSMTPRQGTLTAGYPFTFIAKLS